MGRMWKPITAAEKAMIKENYLSGHPKHVELILMTSAWLLSQATQYSEGLKLRPQNLTKEL